MRLSEERLSIAWRALAFVLKLFKNVSRIEVFRIDIGCVLL